MKNTITVGVVGCGYWGPNLIRNFRAVPGCRLKTICDISEDRLRHLRGLYPEVKCETDFANLLADPEVNAISVATSVRHHYPMAKAALEAGKHVLVEKPLAASVSQCEELVDLAHKKGLVLMVGHTFLFSPAVRKIKSIVDRHEIGEIRYISARRLNLGLFQTDINVAWDLAPHDLSIILYIMNEMPLSVSCRGAANITPGIQDVTTMCLEFAGEKSATVQSSWLDPRKVREMTIVGSERMIVYDDIQVQEKIKIFDVHVKRPPHYDTFADFHYAYHYGDIYSPYVKGEEPLRSECEHFLDCIRHARTPITGGREGLEVVTVLECASASLKANGSPMAIPSGGQRINTSKGSNAPIVLPADPQSASSRR
jgi:predicted dehydrogenase